MPDATYSGDPSASDDDAVRFLIGDTGPVAPETTPVFLLFNEEIAYLLVQYPRVLSAAAAGADALCAKFSRQVDELTGDLQRKCSQKSKQYGELADKLRKQASDPLTTAPVPFAGGVSIADIQSREDDTDRFPDIFNIGEDDSRRGAGLKNQSLLRNGFQQP